MKDKPLFISFQGVGTAFYVWLNGEFVSNSQDSFTPASLGRKCIGFNVEDEKTNATISIDYGLAIDSTVKLKVSYTVYTDGRIKVCSSYQDVNGVPDMSLFGISIKMFADYHNLTGMRIVQKKIISMVLD